ncbi:MAG: protein kinase [Polyangiaceae bacterium]|nr:protein kinase [Polyangiaceae bacterium]
MDQRVAMRGELGATSLANLLATVEQGAQEAEVRLFTELGVGHVWFSGGALIDAELAGVTGEAALGRLMAAEEGRFEVLQGGGGRPQRIQATVKQVLQRQAARTAEWSRLVDTAPNLQSRLWRSDAVGAAERLQPERRAMIELCDGERSVTDVIDASGRDAVEALRELVALISAGYVRAAPSVSQVPPPATLLGHMVAVPVPGAPRLPQLDPELATRRANPIPEPQADRSPGTTRYSSRPGTVEVVPVRPSSHPPSGPPRHDSRPRRSAVGSGVGPGRLEREEIYPAMTRRDGSWVDEYPETASITPRGYRSPTPEQPSVPATPPAPMPPAPPGLPAAPVPTAPEIGEQAAPPALDEVEERPGDPGVPTLLVRNARVSDERFVGRYEVLCRLGRGGMGAVYLCRVTGEAGFRRLFALKVLRHRIEADPSAEGSFLREAYVASRLHHPNAVAVVDAAIHARQPYLVLEYVEGCSLATLLHRSASLRPPELLVTIITDALEGLAAAHALADDEGRPLGLVHGDVSPHNVIVGVDGIGRLSDFGVSRLGHFGVATDPREPLFGRPGFIAPEQALGHQVDQSADLFSMGVVLWNALTGRELFLAPTAEETIANVLSAPIPPPSTVGLRPPTCLDAICLSALARDPRSRPASAEAMAEELRRVATRNQLVAARSNVSHWVREHFRRELEHRRLAILDAARGASRDGRTDEPMLPRAVTMAPPPVAAQAGGARQTGPGRQTPVEQTDGGGTRGASTPVAVDSELPSTQPPPPNPEARPAGGRTRVRNAVVVVASVLALATIAASILRPDMIASWFDIDTTQRHSEPIPSAIVPLGLSMDGSPSPDARSDPPAPSGGPSAAPPSSQRPTAAPVITPSPGNEAP